MGSGLDSGSGFGSTSVFGVRCSVFGFGASGVRGMGLILTWPPVPFRPRSMKHDCLLLPRPVLFLSAKLVAETTTTRKGPLVSSLS